MKNLEARREKIGVDLASMRAITRRSLTRADFTAALEKAAEEEAALDALSLEERLARSRDELAELSSETVKTAEEALWHAFLCRVLEIDIAELEGQSPEECKAQREFACRNFRYKGSPPAVGPEVALRIHEQAAERRKMRECVRRESVDKLRAYRGRQVLLLEPERL